MREAFKSLETWVKFAGFILVVAVLYWAQAVLVPVCLAVLLTFVLAPPVVWLQRRIGRVAAVLVVVVLVFTSLALAGYVVYRQMVSLGDALPAYTANIRAKIHDIRGATPGGSVEKLERTVEELKRDLGAPAPKSGTVAQPIVVQPEPLALAAIAWLGPLLGPLGTAGFVITLVLFMLLERERLRDRVIRLLGHGQLAVTTRAMVEAGERVSRQLLLQTIVNVTYGVLAMAGLYLLGVPYPPFWGALGAALRFIPYVGPITAAVGPIVLAFAALPGWARPLETVGFYVVLELFTNLVLETVLYSEAAGISQVALLVAVAFWTWLWGPLGLVMATPLTVCIVVMGKHVPALEFLDNLLSDAPPLTAERSYYQRVLAGDEAEAADLVDRYLAEHPADEVYDAVLVPALTYAERDRHEGRLSREEEENVVAVTRDMLAMLELGNDKALPSDRESVRPAAAAPLPLDVPLTVLGYAANGTPDDLALRMLGQLLRGMPIALEVASTHLLTSELVAHVRAHQYPVVCIADLPPSAPLKTRYLVKKLHAALPELRIVVGRWAPADLADETFEPLTEAGASHVASVLADTRNYLAEAAHIGTRVQPAPATPDAA